MIGDYKEYIIASCYVNLIGGQIESHKKLGRQIRISGFARFSPRQNLIWRKKIISTQFIIYT